MRRAILLSMLLWSVPLLAAAEDPAQGKINPDVWYLDTEVLLNGSNLLGPVPKTSKLCFAPIADKENRLCFPNGHANIKNWTESNITFIPPINTPPLGVITMLHPTTREECSRVYKEMQCIKKTENVVYEIGTYHAHPAINSIIDAVTKEPTQILIAGKEYDITGYRFGDSGVGVLINGVTIDRTDILAWSFSTIRIRSPQTYEGRTSVEVNNGGGRGNPWMLEGGAITTQEVRTKTRGVVRVDENGKETESGGANFTADVVGEETKETKEAKESKEVEEQIDLSKAPFSDVSLEHPYLEAIAWAMQKEVVHGYPDGTFGPEKNVSRAEFLTMLLKLPTPLELPIEDEIPFSDVFHKAWFADAVRKGRAYGLIEGYRDPTDPEGLPLFRPDQEVTLAEGLKMTYRYLRIPTADSLRSAWYARYVDHAREHEILFDLEQPINGPMKRQDVVWMLWKLDAVQKP